MVARRHFTAAAAALAAVVILGAVATSASAGGFAPLWSQPVTSAARLVVSGGATAVWAAQGAGSSAALLAQRYDAAGQPSGSGPVVLVDGIAGLSDWLAAPGVGGSVIVAWKAGGAVVVAGRTADGGTVFPPVTACTDATVALARGTGATATPVALQADGQGGAYLLLQVTPSSSSGDSLLTYISATGRLASPDPGVAVAKGTAALVAADAEGHLCTLLAGPGRAGVALQRYGPDLKVDWAAPVVPYNPLADPPSAAAQTPVSLGAAAGSWMAWREESSVLVQRFNTSGARLWLRPAAVKAAAGAEAAGDGVGGVYVASVAGTKLSVAHVLAGGSTEGAPAQSALDTGRSGLRIDAVTSDKSGDLDIAFAGSSASIGGVAEMTCLGAWTSPALTPASPGFAVLAGDDSGGVYALEYGDAARLWRLGESGGGLTLRPRTAALSYGQPLTVSGFLTLDGSPLGGTPVQIAPSMGAAPAAPSTSAAGYYEASFKPQASATWTATARTPSGATVTSTAVTVSVAPSISLALVTRRAGSGYVTVLGGEVEPAHPGSTVLVQRQIGGTWRPLASAGLDGSSKYKASWKVPLKTATYLFRAVLPAHADHAEAVSRTARLRVVLTPR